MILNCLDMLTTFFIAAMTPNELAAVRERYTDEKFPGLDMPMDQVSTKKLLNSDKKSQFASDDRHDDQQRPHSSGRLRGNKKSWSASLSIT